MSATPTLLLSSEEALTRVGHDLPYQTLHRWTRSAAVTPTQPATGTGSRVGWSPHDIAMLEAVAQVRQDLDHLGLPCPWKLVRELWDQLDINGYASLAYGTVTITVRLGSEG